VKLGAVLATDRIDLGPASICLVDDNERAMELMTGVLASFGAKGLIRCAGAEPAKDELTQRPIDLLVTSAAMAGVDGYQLTRWIRREAPEENRCIPVIIMVGHTTLAQVREARDCGANYVIAKPVTPKIILDRLFWIARETRGFVETESYVGPDRRFRRLGPPINQPGRRHDDLSEHVGAASSPNLSQQEIDTLMKPQKVSL
jgi:CheY-like chemotaxis protein